MACLYLESGEPLVSVTQLTGYTNLIVSQHNSGFIPMDYGSRFTSSVPESTRKMLENNFRTDEFASIPDQDMSQMISSGVHGIYPPEILPTNSDRVPPCRRSNGQRPCGE